MREGNGRESSYGTTMRNGGKGERGTKGGEEARDSVTFQRHEERIGFYFDRARLVVIVVLS